MEHRLRRISTVLWVVGILIGLLVTNTSLGDGYNRAGINLLLVPTAVVAVVLVWCFPWRRFDRDLFVVTTLTGLLLVPLLIAWSGGWQSPFGAYYYFIVVFSALYYRGRVALLVGGASTLALLSPLLFGFAPPGGQPWLVRLLLINGTTYFSLVYVARAMAGEMVRLYSQALERLREREQARRDLAESEQRYKSLFEHNPDAVYRLDLDGTLLSANPAIKALTGYALEELRELPMRALVAPEDYERALEHFQRAARGEPQSFELALQHKHGRLVDVAITTVPVVVDGRIEGVYGIAKDVTGRTALEYQLAHQAIHDSLTGLPNRALFLDRLAHALARATRHHEAAAVLSLDLDRFKVINDSLGHEAGDLLLIAVAHALARCMRPEDTAARLGGDEFAVLLERAADANDAVRVAERITGALRAAIDLAGQEVFVSASIGIALSSIERDDPVLLLRDAETAMYRAKAGGKARYEVFDQGMGARAMERLELEAGLRHALERGEFVVYYQPKVALATGRIEGLEALVRWQHPGRGLIPPGEFIPMAEEIGLIRPLGRWVLEEACRQAQCWRERYPRGASLGVSVNLAAPQFQQVHLAEDIAQVLRTSGLPPHLLQLEITESVIMDDLPATLATLRRLKELGVRLAIDDFGTGYSSLSYLKRFPVDTLKIDKAFVAGLGADPEDTAIVQAVVGLAHTLGLQVTAEGVETPEQVRQLSAFGCTLAQGYYFARPMSLEALDALLARGRLSWPRPGARPGPHELPTTADLRAAR